jgi:putative ABC transport system ATP-binding protein
VGRSGSGKSTLLHLAAGIEIPDRGTIRLGGRDLGAESEHERTKLRRREVGLVFQFFQLLPHLSVRDNVALPRWIAGVPEREYDERLRDLLDRVGLRDRERQNVQTLSGGEQQRVALCRALLPAPRLLLADEPTGNLDDETGRSAMDLLFRLAQEEGSSLVLVTHSRELAERADEMRILQNGVLAPR